MEFSKQEYWSGLPLPSLVDLPDPGIEPGFPAMQADSLLTEPRGKPTLYGTAVNIKINKFILKKRKGTELLRKKNQKIIYVQGFKFMDFPGGSDDKASAYNAGNPGSIPGLGRSPGEGNGNPLQYYGLENPMEGGAW